MLHKGYVKKQDNWQPLLMSENYIYNGLNPGVNARK